MDSISKSDIDKIFGKILRKFRKKSGLTQEQLAEQLGISLKYISRIENGNNGIKTQTLIKYMNILKITPNTLYKEFITDSQTKKNIELTEKICSLSEEKKVFITSVIDLLNDMVKTNSTELVFTIFILFFPKCFISFICRINIIFTCNFIWCMHRKNWNSTIYYICSFISYNICNGSSTTNIDFS